MSCIGCHRVRPGGRLIHKLHDMDLGLVDKAKRVLKSAGDPFSGVIRFLADRPEGSSLTGYVVDHVLIETFGSEEKIPGLVRILAAHMREVIRQANVINIINEHPAMETWENYLIKQKERIKFEIALEKGKLVLTNIVGLTAVEFGVEMPLNKITVQPPKLLVTVGHGLVSVQRTVDI